MKVLLMCIYLSFYNLPQIFSEGVTADNVNNLFDISSEITNKYNFISTISENAFENVEKAVIKFSIQNCYHLRQLPARLFKSSRYLESITIIVIKKTLISKLPEKLFSNLVNLENITLSENKLISLPPHMFEENQQLFLVSVSSNDIRQLSPELFKQNKKLKIIDFNHNKLESFPTPFLYTTGRIIQIKLDHNKLEAITDATFDNIDLTNTDLHLSYNYLVCLPAVIKKQKKEYVMIEDNCFHDMSEVCQIFQCKNNQICSQKSDENKCTQKEENYEENKHRLDSTYVFVVYILLSCSLNFFIIGFTLFTLAKEFPTFAKPFTWVLACYRAIFKKNDNQPARNSSKRLHPVIHVSKL